MKAHLKILNVKTQRSGSVILNLFWNGVSIGRSECDLKLFDPSCSAFHALLCTRGDNEIWIRDLNSRNGIYVNGTKVSEAQMAVGSELQLGSTIIKLERLDTSTGQF